MSVHGGLLGGITEAIEIAEQLGCSFDEAYRIRCERSDESTAAAEAEQAAAEQAAAESNVIQFRPRS